MNILLTLYDLQYFHVFIFRPILSTLCDQNQIWAFHSHIRAAYQGGRQYRQAPEGSDQTDEVTLSLKYSSSDFYLFLCNNYVIMYRSLHPPRLPDQRTRLHRQAQGGAGSERTTTPETGSQAQPRLARSQTVREEKEDLCH